MATAFDEAFNAGGFGGSEVMPAEPMTAPAPIQAAPLQVAPTEDLSGFSSLAQAGPVQAPLGATVTPLVPPPANEPEIPNIPGASAERSMNVGRASQEISQRLGLRTAVSYHTGAGQESRSQEEVDMARLSFAEQDAKYGHETASQMRQAWAGGQQAWANLMSGPERTNSQILGDSIFDATNMVTSGAGNLLGLGASLTIDPLTGSTVGPAISRGVEAFSEWLREPQSRTLHDRRTLGEIRSSLSQEDNDQQFERDRQNVGPVTAHMRRIGRGLVDGVMNTVADPVTLTSGLAEGVGSLFAVGKLATSLRAIGRAAMPVAVGASEGAGAYQQTVSEILNTSFEDLTKNSPTFRELISRGMTREDARTQIAQDAGRTAAAIQAPLAAAAGLVTHRLSERIAGRVLPQLEQAPLRVGSLGSAAGQIIGEFAEEALQSGSGGAAQNLGIMAAGGDDTRSWSEGVGEQAGQGGVLGAFTAGSLQAPGASLRAAGRGARAIGGAIADTAEAITERREAATESASPLSEPVVREEAKAVQETVAPAVQAATQTIAESTTLTPEQQASGTAFVERVARSNQLDPGFVSSTPTDVQSVLKGSTDQVDAFYRVAKALEGTKDETKQRELAQTLISLNERLDDLMDVDPDEMQGILPADHPVMDTMSRFQTLAASVQRSPAIQRALAKAQEVVAPTIAIPEPKVEAPPAPAPAPKPKLMESIKKFEGSSTIPGRLSTIASEVKAQPTTDTYSKSNSEFTQRSLGEYGEIAQAIIDEKPSKLDQGDGLWPTLHSKYLSLKSRVGKPGGLTQAQFDRLPVEAEIDDLAKKAWRVRNPGVETIGDRLAREQAEKKPAPKAEPKQEQDAPPTEEELDMLLRTAANDPRELSPEQVKRAGVVMRMASSGKINLTEAQKAILKNASASLEGARRYIAGKKAMGNLNALDDVTDMALILDTPKKVNQRSASRHAKDILTAVKAGEITKAKNLLTDMGKFVRHYNNQLDVMNEIFETRPGGRGSASFQALSLEGDPTTEGGRGFVTSEKMTGISPKNETNVAHAQRVHLEAERLAFVYNSLVEALPSLGGTKIEAVGLNEALLGNTKQVVSDFQKGLRKPGPKVVTRAPVSLVPEADISTNSGRPVIVNDDGTTTDPSNPKEVRQALKAAQNKVYALVRRMNRLESQGIPIDDETQADYEFWVKNLAEIAAIRDGFTEPFPVVPKQEETTQRESTPEALSEVEQAINRARAEVERLTDLGDLTEQQELEYRSWEREFNQLLALYASMTNQSPPEIAAPIPTAPALNDSLVPPAALPAPKKATPEEKKAQRVAAMKEMFPSLLGSNLGSNIVNKFVSAFYIPETPSSRLMVDSPLRLMSGMLANYSTAVGGNSQGRMTPAIQRAYDQLLGMAEQAKAQVNERLVNRLSKTNKTGSRAGLSALQIMETAGDAGGLQLNNRHDGRALNIAELRIDHIAYNDQLIESAILAGMQWLISNLNNSSNYDAEYVGKILNLDEGAAAQYVDIFNSGTHTLAMHQDLAGRVASYWGLNKDRDTPKGHTDGIPLGVAAEVLEAFEAMGLITGQEHIVEEGIAGTDQTREMKYKFWNVNPTAFLGETYDESGDLTGKLNPIRGFPNAIEKASLFTPVDESYYDQEVPKPDTSQVNTPYVPLRPTQTSALKNANGTSYYADEHVVGLYLALKSDGVRDLFGEGDTSSKERKINVNHRKTLEGRNLGLISAFQALMGRLVEMKNISGDAWDELAVHFPHGINRIGRLQNLDRFNPQSNKLIREAILSTWSTLDLTKESHQRFFEIGMAQALEIKVHQMSYDMIQQKLEKRLADLEPIMEVLRNRAPNEALPEDFVQLAKSIFKKAGIASTPLAMRALLDHTRLGKTNDRSAFETSLYVEADGVTNGIVNGIHMFTSGGFTEDWVANVAKGGFFIRQNGVNTMGEQFTSAEGSAVDLYTAGATKLKDTLREFIQTLSTKRSWPEAPNLKEHALQLSNLMAVLLPDMSFDASSGKININRGFTKRPMTITLYGSGLDGISKKITKLMLDEIYMRKTMEAEILQRGGDPRSEVFLPDVTEEALKAELNLTPEELSVVAQQRWDTYQASLNDQTKVGVHDNKGTLGFHGAVKKGEKLTPLDQNPESFTLDRARREALNSSIRNLFVTPLGSAIKDVIGATLGDNAKRVQKATHIQGMVLQAKFKEAMEEAMAFNEANIPGWTRRDFLSENQLTEILVSLERYAPLIRTENQQFFIPASDRMQLEGVPGFGSSLSQGFHTAATVFGPGNVGVSGLPILNIGMGDGMMIQVFMNEAGDYRVVPIYDGINLPLDMADVLSRKANEAAYISWQGNPAKEVHNSFSAFLGAVTENDFPLAMYKDLSRSLEVVIDETSDVIPYLRELNESLKVSAHSIEVMHRVIDGVSTRTDQMASVGAPFVKDTGVKLEGTDAEVAEALQRRYVQELRRSAQTYSGVSSFLVGTGQHILSKLPLSESQRSVMDQIVGSLNAKNYRVVYGSPSEIDEYQILNGMERHSLKTTEDGKRTHGLISTGENVIYVARDTNNENEAVLHELIHATTFEHLMDYYNNRSVPAHVRDAIKRLEILGDQFLELDPKMFSRSVALSESYQNARRAIMENRPYGVWGPMALNEFMAWTQANENLSEQLSIISANPIVRIVKEALQAIWSLLFGSRNVVPPRVGKDMFSNILFNNTILMNSQPSVSDMSSDAVMAMSSAFGNDERLASLRKTFDTMVTRFLDAPNGFEKLQRQGKLKTAVIGSVTAAISAEAHGFPEMTMQERTIFEKIVTALSVGMVVDPPAISAMEELYRHIIKVMSPDHFMKDPIAREPNDEFQANQKYNTLLGTYNLTKDTEGRSSLLPVFFALAATNASVREMLTKIPLPKEEKNQSKGWDGRLYKVTNSLMENVSNKLSGIDTRAQTHMGEAVDALIHTIQEMTQQEQSYLEQFSKPIGNGIDRTNDWVVKAASRAGRTIQQLAKDIGEKSNSKLVRTLTKSAELAARAARQDSGAEIARGITHFLNQQGGMNIARDLWSDIVGRTESNAGPDDMIKIVRTEVQQDRQEYRETVPTIIASKFTRTLAEGERSAVFHTMGQTDLASLVNGHSGLSNQDILSLVQDGKRLGAHIKSLENQLSKMDAPNAQVLIRKSQQLAGYMVTRETGKNLLRNARSVASLWDEPQSKNRPAPSDELVSLIDELTSLYALEKTSKTDRDILGILAKDETTGMDFVLSYLVGQRVDENAKSQSGLARNNAFKGFIPSEQMDGVNLLVADDKEFTRLSQKSYVRVGDYEGSKAEWGASKKGYYFASVNGRSPFNQGTFQNVRYTAGGVDANTGLMHDGLSAGAITDKATVERITKGMVREKGTMENLLPVRDALGQIVAYERSVNPGMLTKLSQDQDIFKMIGVWRGRQVEEFKAQGFNDMLVKKLHEMYRNEVLYDDQRKLEYVNLLDPRADIDPVTRDAFKLVNEKTKDYAQDLFGEGQFWVRRDSLKDAFGYRSASIGDAWTGNSRWSPEVQKVVKDMSIAMFGNKAYGWMVKTESQIQNLVKDAKTLIVIKSIVVPVANAGSNILQMIGRGIPLRTITTQMPRKLTEVHFYNKSRLRKVRLEAELRAVENNPIKANPLKAEIQSIEDSHKRLSIWPLLKAGEFSSITEANVNPDDTLLTGGSLTDYMERKVNQLPKPIRDAGRYAIIAKDTALFQGLQKAVAYSDFIAKAITYDDLMERQGKTSAQALAKITEEFVNYDRLPGRARGYLEGIGLLWFWNFKLRFTKVALSMIRDNPVHALLGSVVPVPSFLGSIEMPINDSMPFKLMDGSLGSSIGVDQGLAAPGMNPFWRLLH